jgi:hypothetical protein
MRTLLSIIGCVALLASHGRAQQWEFGAIAGYGWNHDATIANGPASASAGFHPGFALGTVLGENMYNYIGGEFRYLFRWGSPLIDYQGTRASANGYSNILTYDLLVHMTPRDNRLRPYVAGGAGIKIYTSTNDQPFVQPLKDFAVILPVTQVEPAISVGGGIKYRVARHVQIRADFRAYMTPLPNQLFRPTGSSISRGWLFDFMPQVGIGYLF